MLPIAIAAIVFFVTGGFAARKGYNFVIWGLAGGLLSLLVMAFLPFANKADQDAETKRLLVSRGDRIGLVLVVVTALGAAFVMFAR